MRALRSRTALVVLMAGFALPFDPYCGGLIADRKATVKKKTGKFSLTDVVTGDGGTYTVTLKGKFTGKTSAKGDL